MFHYGKDETRFAKQILEVHSTREISNPVGLAYKNSLFYEVILLNIDR